MLSGCGSASVHELPPAVSPLPGAAAETTVQGARTLAVVSGRERTLELYDAATRRRIGTAPAGVGPTHVACLGAWCYVVDTRGGALLVFKTRPRLEPTRRLYLPGEPYEITVDPRRRRLFVTLRALDQVVELPAHGRPHVLRRWSSAPG